MCYYFLCDIRCVPKASPLHALISKINHKSIHYSRSELGLAPILNTKIQLFHGAPGSLVAFSTEQLFATWKETLFR